MPVSFPGEPTEYRSARGGLLDREIELRRATEAVAQARRELPPGVYLLALSAAVRLLTGALRALAAVALAVTTVTAGFSGGFLALPAGAAAFALAVPRLRARTPPRARRHTQAASAGEGPPPRAEDETPPPPPDHPLDDTARFSLIGRKPSPRFRLEHFVLVPGGERPPDGVTRRAALVVVEHGEIELELTNQLCQRFASGAVLSTAGLPLRLIRNVGANTVLMSFLSQRAAEEST